MSTIETLSADVQALTTAVTNLESANSALVKGYEALKAQLASGATTISPADQALLDAADAAVNAATTSINTTTAVDTAA